MKGTSGNVRSNMFIYKLAAEGASESAVVMMEDGDAGKYNRGNRSLYHFLENGTPMILGIVLNSIVYPRPVFFLFIFYCIGRIGYTIGYTNKGYGGHALGFMCDRFAYLIMMGMHLLIAIKAF